MILFLFLLFTKCFFCYAGKAANDESDFQLTTSNLKHDGLRSFPKPIAKILDQYISSILRDFVESWYLYIGPDEKDFMEETRIALEHIIVELQRSLQNFEFAKRYSESYTCFSKTHQNI